VNVYIETDDENYDYDDFAVDVHDMLELDFSLSGKNDVAFWRKEC
jgi:hypothetical protein